MAIRGTVAAGKRVCVAVARCVSLTRRGEQAMPQVSQPGRGGTCRGCKPKDTPGHTSGSQHRNRVASFAAVLCLCIVVQAPTARSQEGSRTLLLPFAITAEPMRIMDAHSALRLLSVTDVAPGPQNTILVADQRAGQVLVFGRDLAFRLSVGRVGNRPGEYRELIAVANWTSNRFIAVERYLRRLDIYSERGGRVVLTRSINLAFEPYDACATGPNEIVVLGLQGGKKLHVVDSMGSVRRSFAPMDSSVPAEVARDNWIAGRVFCPVRNGTLVLVPNVSPIVESYQLRSGRLAARDTLRPYRPLLYSATGRGTSYRSGAGGFSLAAGGFEMGYLRIVQTGYEARTDGASEDTVFLLGRDEKSGRVSTTVTGGLLYAIDDSTVLAVLQRGRPVLTLYRLHANASGRGR